MINLFLDPLYIDIYSWIRKNSIWTHSLVQRSLEEHNLIFSLFSSHCYMSFLSFRSLWKPDSENHQYTQSPTKTTDWEYAIPALLLLPEGIKYLNDEYIQIYGCRLWVCVCIHTSTGTYCFSFSSQKQIK